MRIETDLERIRVIAEALRREVFERIQLRGVAVFLVGASHASSFSLRDPLRRELSGKRYIRGFDVYYPEELFEELLTGDERTDLLELENMLASSVHAVVILLESPGAVAELGAFANHGELQNKLVVVVDKRYRRKKSFIMMGPVAHLHAKTKSEVIYHDFRRAEIGKLGEEVRSAVRRVIKDVQVEATLSNPVAVQHYLRAAIHAFGRASALTLLNVVKTGGVGNEGEVWAVVNTSLSILRRQGEIVLGADNRYSLTGAGRRRLQAMLRLELWGRSMEDALDRIRLDVMTWTLRRPRRLAV